MIHVFTHTQLRHLHGFTYMLDIQIYFPITNNEWRT